MDKLRAIKVELRDVLALKQTRATKKRARELRAALTREVLKDHPAVDYRRVRS